MYIIIICNFFPFLWTRTRYLLECYYSDFCLFVCFCFHLEKVNFHRINFKIITQHALCFWRKSHCRIQGGYSHLGKRRYQSIYPFQNRKIFYFLFSLFFTLFPLFKFFFVFYFTGSSLLCGLSLVVVTAENHLLVAMCGTPVAEHGV